MITYILFVLFYLASAMLTNIFFAARDYRASRNHGGSHEQAKEYAKNLSWFPIALFWPAVLICVLFSFLMNKIDKILEKILDKSLEKLFNKKQ